VSGVRWKLRKLYKKQAFKILIIQKKFRIKVPTRTQDIHHIGIIRNLI